MYPGERKQHLFFVTNDAKATAKTLAAFAGVAQGEFVETLIRRFGPVCAADMKLERDSLDPKDSGQLADSLVGGAAVPDGARSQD